MSNGDIAGWIGAILVLIAYYMVSSGRAKPDSSGFQLINIIGAIFLIYYTYNCKAYASMAVNIIWVFIGLNSFVRLLKLNNLKFDLNNLSFRRLQMKQLAIALLLISFSFPVLAGKECKKNYKIDCSKVKDAKKDYFCSKNSKVSEKKKERFCKKLKKKSKMIKKKNKEKK